ncbi:MAG: hypothetical protein ACI4E4_07100 [Acetatifactor sp.]
MKRKIKMFLPLVCLAVLLMGMTVLASSYETETFCGNCGAALLSGAREAGHWETTHMVGTGQFLNGEEITERCTIQYVKTVLEKFCPNGHGVKASTVQTDEYHSSKRCFDR